MLEYIIASTLECLVVTITGLYIFLNDETDEQDYKNIKRSIFDSNVMDMSLIITEGKYGAIDADDYSCHGYYIIKNCHLHLTFNQT